MNIERINSVLNWVIAVEVGAIVGYGIYAGLMLVFGGSA